MQFPCLFHPVHERERGGDGSRSLCLFLVAVAGDASCLVLLGRVRSWVGGGSWGGGGQSSPRLSLSLSHCHSTSRSSRRLLLLLLLRLRCSPSESFSFQPFPPPTLHSPAFFSFSQSSPGKTQVCEACQCFPPCAARHRGGCRRGGRERCCSRTPVVVFTPVSWLRTEEVGIIVSLSGLVLTSICHMRLRSVELGHDAGGYSPLLQRG